MTKAGIILGGVNTQKTIITRKLIISEYRCKQTIMSKESSISSGPLSWPAFHRISLMVLPLLRFSSPGHLLLALG